MRITNRRLSLKTYRSSASWPLPLSSSEAKQKAECRPSERRERVLQVQATNERLHVVCQEVQGGVHTNVPWKRQQVGANQLSSRVLNSKQKLIKNSILSVVINSTNWIRNIG